MILTALKNPHVVAVVGRVNPDVLAAIFKGYGSHCASNTADTPLLAHASLTGR